MDPRVVQEDRQAEEEAVDPQQVVPAQDQGMPQEGPS